MPLSRGNTTVSFGHFGISRSHGAPYLLMDSKTSRRRSCRKELQKIGTAASGSPHEDKFKGGDVLIADAKKVRLEFRERNVEKYI